MKAAVVVGLNFEKNREIKAALLKKLVDKGLRKT